MPSSGKSDWVVVMRRFDEDGLLDRMAERGPLTPDLMASLGARIASYHDGLPPIRDGFGRPDDYRHSVAADIRQMREQGERLDPEASEALAEKMPRRAGAVHRPRRAPRRGRRDPPLPWRHAPAQHRPDRRQADAVRRDRVLRAHRQHRRALRPLVRADGPVRAQAAAARQPAAQRMDAGASPSCRGAACTRRWRCCRCSCRAAPRSAPSSIRRPAAVGNGDTSRARGTTSAWRCRSCEPAPPRLMAIGGLSGSGKTTTAIRRAPEIGRVPGAVVVRSDVERKRLAGIPLEQRMPTGSYTPEASDKVYAAMLDARRAGVARRPQRDPRRGVRQAGGAADRRGAGAKGGRAVRGPVARGAEGSGAGPRRGATAPTPRTPRRPWSSGNSATIWAEITWRRLDASARSE